MSALKTICICAAVAALACSATAGSLGVANDYNVFILGSASQSYTDSQGSVAVGGSAVYLGYGIADALSGFTGPSLVVGGSLNYQQGSIFWGDVHVGGAATITNGGTIAHGTIHCPSSPIDFVGARNYLNAASALWGAQQTTGAVDITPWNSITLTGSNPTLNVFNVPGSKLSSCVGMTINAPAGSTVLVNVDGTQGSLSNFAMSLNGPSAGSVLYNYTQATSLAISGIDVRGSLLAPLAAINFSNGQINGTLIGASLTGSGEEHNVLFGGKLPTVPEPSSLFALGTAVVGLAAFVTRRRRTM